MDIIRAKALGTYQVHRRREHCCRNPDTRYDGILLNRNLPLSRPFLAGESARILFPGRTPGKERVENACRAVQLRLPVTVRWLDDVRAGRAMVHRFLQWVALADTESLCMTVRDYLFCVLVFLSTRRRLSLPLEIIGYITGFLAPSMVSPAPEDSLAFTLRRLRGHPSLGEFARLYADLCPAFDRIYSIAGSCPRCLSAPAFPAPFSPPRLWKNGHAGRAMITMREGSAARLHPMRMQLVLADLGASVTRWRSEMLRRLSGLRREWLVIVRVLQSPVVVRSRKRKLGEV